jgi:hypothetical protein
VYLSSPSTSPRRLCPPGQGTSDLLLSHLTEPSGVPGVYWALGEPGGWVQWEEVGGGCRGPSLDAVEPGDGSSILQPWGRMAQCSLQCHCFLVCFLSKQGLLIRKASNCVKRSSPGKSFWC